VVSVRLFKIRIFKNLSWLKYFGHYVTTPGVYSEVVAYYFTALASVPGCIRYNGGSDAITHRRMTVFNYVIFPVVHSMHLSVNKIACTLYKRNLIQVLKHCSLEVILSINIKSLYSNLNFFFNNSNLQIVKRCIGWCAPIFLTYITRAKNKMCSSLVFYGSVYSTNWFFFYPSCGCFEQLWKFLRFVQKNFYWCSWCG
jgi:hypothetical protein